MTKFILKVICVVETSLLVGIAGVFVGMLLPTVAKKTIDKMLGSGNDKKHKRPDRYTDYSRHYKSMFEDEES